MKNVLKLMGLSGAIIAPMAFAPMTMAAGFQLNEFSVASMGRAHAGEPAMHDNAGVIARNPAAAGMFEKRNYSLVVHYIDPDIDVEGEVTSQYAPGLTANADADDVAPSAVIPGFYYVSPINDQWSWGISMNSHFGLSTDYGSNYAGSEFAQETSIKTYYITPVVAFKPVESLSLGLGISYIHGEGYIENSSSQTFSTITSVPKGTTLLKLDGDGDEFGWQAGLLWDINASHHLGIRYQSAVDLEFEGDLDIFDSSVGAVRKLDGSLTADLPEMFEVGYVFDVNDEWKFMLGAQMTGWSSFEDLTAEDLSENISGSDKKKLKTENWDDAWRYSIGAETQLNEMTTLRFGYAFDESPVEDEHRTLTIPDADRNWYTIGATFDLHDSNVFDISFVYIDGDSVEVNETQEAPSPSYTTFDGELTATNVYIVSLGYNYSF